MPRALETELTTQGTAPCPRCGAKGDEAGWCTVCGANLRPEVPHRFSAKAQDQEREWLRDPERAASLAAKRAADPGPELAPDLPSSARPQLGANTTARTTPTTTDRVTGQLDTTRPEPLGAIVALAGAVVLLIGAFLPYAGSVPGLSRVEDNSLIQNGDGWVNLLVVAVALWRIYHAWRGNTRGIWLLVMGVANTAFFIWLIADSSQREVNPIGIDGTRDTSTTLVASPGIGLWVSLVGGLLLLAGALVMLRLRMSVAPTSASTAAPLAAPAPAATATERASALDTLARLHQQGALNDDEFAAEKAKVLDS